MAAKKEVAVEVVEKAKKALAALPGKQPAKKGLEAALQELKPEIETLLEEKGYTRQEIVDQLVKQGIPAKLYLIKKLLLTPRAAPSAPETPAT